MFGKILDVDELEQELNDMVALEMNDNIPNAQNTLIKPINQNIP